MPISGKENYMKIIICGSISSTEKIKKVSDKLTAMGHETEIPYTSSKIISGKLTLKEYFIEIEKNGDNNLRNQAEHDLIKRYYNFIKNSDAILVLNIDKNGIKNYIGGNALIEIGFAYVLDKKIYFYNDIPEMPYSDELRAMKPVVINGDLKKII